MPNQQLSGRKLQSLQTKKNIYNSTLELMHEKSLEKIRIEDICRRAGVSVGSFYNHFKTKSDILVEMYAQADDYFELKFKNEPPSESIVQDIIQYFEVYAEYNQNIGLETVKQLYTTNNKLFITKGRDMQNILQQIIERGQAAGELDQSMTSEEMTDYLFIAARGVMYNWCLHDGDSNLIVNMREYMSRLITIFKQKN
ncbi:MULTISPECIES: TetR/AcrR family transcriptional regulator [Paenibacillus]|uniref:TetR family transcriptional regulator n=2 Tax=Paenibacillus TaxID=44249 RepID=A0AAJ3IZ65_PAEPO|nr:MULTISPECIES: TetR/AcrR family transcriptional regulator [Paenibacillus]ALA40649.1 TetR family transcriptional regulator [Paenibacillus peoriae]APQ57916.1 TetR family transcriptional regulator [Paenibacillus polymyxa]MDH2333672.1 TetR/AcrR family transcriptional regulator [Paenibacillus polymyxa]MDR6781004.1 AcrR family transcriptional regulator [Paenibacillus peoriae]ODA07586.1 TetR family transcriptional regulator [Paenibacillus polymyxa]